MRENRLLTCYRGVTRAFFGLTRPLWTCWACVEGEDGMLQGKLASLPLRISEAAPYDIWLQAVSMGEVAAAEAIVDALEARCPELKIVVSSSTPAGYAKAVSSLGDRCTVIPFPLDFPQVVSRAVEQLRPRVYASVETELWPNLLQELRGRGVATVLLNGRISARSLPRYRRIRSMIAPLLAGFDRVAAISETTAGRLQELGADPGRMVVLGNAKFEALLHRPDPRRAQAVRSRIGMEKGARVLVAGSLRGKEGALVLDAYMQLLHAFPKLYLFLVPRHLSRLSYLRRQLRKRKLEYRLWTRVEEEGIGRARVVLVDVIGPLYDLYGLAHVTFVGGSLAPKGGQNLMEPASWGKPVIFGPHVDNFEDASTALLEQGGGWMVSNGSELVSAFRRLLNDEELRTDMGERARQALKELSGEAASRHAELLLDVYRERVEVNENKGGG